MNKDTVSIIEGAICICSGVAVADIIHSTVKELPHGRGLVKGVGRLGLYAGAFVAGAEAAAKAIKLGEGVFDVTKKHVDAFKEELKKQKEESDDATEDPEVEEVTETPSDDISDENEYEE